MDSPDILQNDVNPNEPQIQPTAAPVAAPVVAAPVQSAPAPQPQAQPATGSFADRLGTALQTFSQHPGTSALIDAPGGFSKMILAAAADALAPSKPLPQPSNAQRVVNGVENFFSPLAAFKNAPIGGAGVVAAQDQAQREAQRQQQIKEQSEQSREQREKLQFGMNIALSNSQMLHSQFLLHKAQSDELKANAVDGQKAVETLKSQPEPGVELKRDVTSDEIQRMIQNGSFNPSTMTAFQTGTNQVGEDDNGNPQYRATYTLVELPKQVRITDPAEAKALIPDLSQESLAKISDGNPLVLPGDTYNARFQANETARAVKATAQKAAEETAIATGERAEKIEAMNFAGNTVFANDMSTFAKQHPNLSHPEIVLGALAMLQQNPPVDANGQPKYPNLAQDVVSALGEKNLDAIETAAETARKDRAEEANKAAELQQKKQQTVISNLTGDDYLQTLPMAQRATVQAVGEGRQLLPANRKEALALLEQVHQAYPDFDESKVKTWQKANNEYRGSGKTATQIVPAYNTALEHMQDLYTNTTGEGIFNPLSKAYQDREVALGYVSREVGKAVSSGAMTQKEGEDLLGTLKGGLTPSLKRERITKTAQLLHDKIDEYQTKFNESAPSSAVKVPTLISPKAALSYDFVASGGQAQQPQTQVFNSRAWAAANPGKDVNAAIAQAKQQGYQVQ